MVIDMDRETETTGKTKMQKLTIIDGKDGSKAATWVADDLDIIVVDEKDIVTAAKQMGYKIEKEA